MLSGAASAVGHTVDNSIPLSIFPIATDKFCFCFCGLPGRGKTHISRKLARYLSFFHAMPVKLLNVSEYRRQHHGIIRDAQWFDPTNHEAEKIRAQYVFLVCCMFSCDPVVKLNFSCNSLLVTDALEFLNQNSNGVAIIDTVNGTVERRAKLVAKVDISSVLGRLALHDILNVFSRSFDRREPRSYSSKSRTRTKPSCLCSTSKLRIHHLTMWA